jgi:hypothetical protein
LAQTLLNIKSLIVKAIVYQKKNARNLIEEDESVKTLKREFLIRIDTLKAVQDALEGKEHRLKILGGQDDF